MDFFLLLPFIIYFIYFVMIVTLFYALYIISRNSALQTKILREILQELKSKRNDMQ